ncbi:MAG TPA: serine hydrolase domain-containing protein [Phnomibacter sp.]|nr:serine hydrolase domain-containing protein [Phnomibacter sp.]
MKATILLIFLSTSIIAQPGIDGIDAFVKKQMEEKQLVGMSIGVIKNGTIIHAKGYGLANIEHHVPATERTVYKLASISKHMIALAIMKFVEEGKLSLDASCTKFFPDAPAAWQKITIRHLLDHTSGLVRESPAFRPMVVQPDSVLIRAAYKEPLVFETGTKWQYCNLGYFMLADIIRLISGKPFQQYMTEDIFLKHAFIQTQPTNTKMIVPHRAGAYIRAGGDRIFNAEEFVAFRPSGAFMSNIDEMLQWELLMQRGQLLSKSYLQQMWSDTVTTTSSHPGANSVSYGYGWNRSIYKGRTVVYHGGSLPGFRTLYYRYPDERTAIIILVNSEPANLLPIALEISDLIFNDQ